MKHLVMTILLFFFVQGVNAQSHVSKSEYPRFNCRFAPKGSNNSEGKLMCPACQKEDDDARKKKIADDKAADNANRLNNVKLKKESIIAFKKNKEEVAKRNRVTEVSVSIPAGTVAKNNATPKKIEPKATKSERFMSGGGGGNYFYNEQGKISSGPNAQPLEIDRAYGTWKLDDKPVARYLHPAETGVILYKSSEYCNGWSLRYYDIVDHDLNPLFKDKSVHYIEHFYENWFLIGYLPCDSYVRNGEKRFESFKLYNVVSKKFSPLKIEEAFSSLELISTYSSYGNAVGDFVFHNRFLESGVYNTFSKSFGDKPLENRSYELLIDKLAGGNDKWKAAACIRVSKSLNDYYYHVYVMAEDNSFKTFKVSLDEFRSYYSKHL